MNKIITLRVSLHLPYMVKHKVLLDKWRSRSWMLLLVMGSWCYVALFPVLSHLLCLIACSMLSCAIVCCCVLLCACHKQSNTAGMKGLGMKLNYMMSSQAMVYQQMLM